MTELSYPAFPKRAFLAIGAVALALMAGAVIVNHGGRSLHGCAIAAERVMAARSYSADMMELIGPGTVPACRGLTARQYAQALLDAYRIEYGKHLPEVPINYAVPPPAFKALSAQDESRSP